MRLRELLTLKKDKPAARILYKFITTEEEIGELEIAKAISSVVTHALIECEHSETFEECQKKHEGYCVEQLSLLLYSVTACNIDIEEARDRLRRLYYV